MSTVSSLDPTTFDASLLTQQLSASTAVDQNSFAAQLAQILASSQGQSSADQTSQTPDTNSAALATQISQLGAVDPSASSSQASQLQTNLASPDSSAMLQDLNLQASLALSQGNAPVVSTLETMIALQMNGAGQSPASQAQTPAQAAATSSTAASATATNPQSSQQTASNASTNFLPLGTSDPSEDYYGSDTPSAPTEYLASGYDS